MHFKNFKKNFTLTIMAIVMVLGITYMKPVQAEASNYQRWMQVCNSMLNNLSAYGFRYGNSGTKGTFQQGLASGRKCNCALYVSWCLQEYGATAPGNRFYVKGGGGIKANFRFGPNVQIIKVGRKCSGVTLRPGDVVCWGSGTAHANVYVGSSNGTKFWYDGGKVATAGNRKGSRYVHRGARHFGYLDKRKISYVIRIRDLF